MNSHLLVGFDRDPKSRFKLAHHTGNQATLEISEV